MKFWSIRFSRSTMIMRAPEAEGFEEAAASSVESESAAAAKGSFTHHRQA